ncbi:MAG: GNAT family N-acetyltransferase [Patescibacteria group bacterium]
MNEGTLMSRFDAKVLRSKPQVLHQLAELYCDIFSMDPNFGEYRQCPVCKGYFNHQQVEVEGVRFCENNHPKTEIVPAWEVEKVKVEILDQSSEQGFFGVLAFLNQKVVGFAWARVILFPEVRKHWGDKIIDKVQPYAKTLNLVYFDELAVDLKKRNKGLGKEMVVFVCRWAKQEHPDDMTLLRTHKDSPAKHIYESIGYIIFADDTEYGGGRVMMKADRCRDLNVTV